MHYSPVVQVREPLGSTARPSTHRVARTVAPACDRVGTTTLTEAAITLRNSSGRFFRPVPTRWKGPTDTIEEVVHRSQSIHPLLHATLVAPVVERHAAEVREIDTRMGIETTALTAARTATRMDIKHAVDASRRENTAHSISTHFLWDEPGAEAGALASKLVVRESMRPGKHMSKRPMPIGNRTNQPLRANLRILRPMAPARDSAREADRNMVSALPR